MIEESKATVSWLKELHESQQNMRMQEESSTHGCNYEQMAADSSLLEAGPTPMEDQGEFDPSLNFISLAIDPPNSLI